jgi:hypothetical protein
LNVFIGAGGLADEHQFCTGIAYAEDNLLAALFGQTAAGAVTDVFADGEQAMGWIGLGLYLVEKIVWDSGDGFGSGQWVSLFWLELNWCWTLAAIKIVDAEFVVEADAVGEGAFELRIEGHGKRLQVEDNRLGF